MQLAYIAQDFEVVFTTMNNITATGTTTPVPSTALTNYYLDKTMHVLHEMMQVKLETLDNAQDVNFREEDGYQWRMKMLENVFNAYLQYNKRKFTRILPKLEDMLRALMFSVTFYQRRKKEKMKLHRLQASVVERGNAELATQSQEDDLYFIAEDPSQTQSGSSGVEASTTEDETQDDQDDHLEAIAEMPIRDLLAWVNTKITAYNQKNAAINASQSGDISGIKKKRGRPASKVNTGSNVTDTTAETSIERDGMEEDVEEFNAQPFPKQVRFSSDCELPFDGQELFMETFEGIHEDEVLL